MEPSLHYRCARASDGSILDVTKLTERPTGVRCLGCDRPMVTRMGTVRAWHFAHKSVGQCSPETYRHILAKNLFRLKFREAVRESKPFLVELTYPVHCHLRPSFPECEDAFEPCLRSWDLTRRFNNVRLEEREGPFVWDALLVHSEHPDHKLPVEMRVTHECSLEKKASGKIIEINVFDETVVDAFDEFCIYTGTFTTYNIYPKPITQQMPCLCLQLKASRLKHEKEHAAWLKQDAERRLLQEEKDRVQKEKDREREATRQEQARLRKETERRVRQQLKRSDVLFALAEQSAPYTRYELRSTGVLEESAGTWQISRPGQRAKRLPVSIGKVMASLNYASQDGCLYFDNERGLCIRQVRRDWKPYVVEASDGREECFWKLALALAKYKDIANAMDHGK